MNKKLARRNERRNRLIELAAAQRVTLAQELVPWRMPLAVGDRGLTAWKYIKRNPEWLIGGALLLVAMGPGRIGSWLGRGLVGWRILESLREGNQQAASLPLTSDQKID